MTQPHPKRCETCTNDECDFNENRWGSTWHNDIYYFMKKCGCASHSSASEPVPEQMGDPWNCTDLGIECPDPEQDWCSWPCDKWWLLCHDAIIATKARVEVLDLLIAYRKAQSKEFGIQTVWEGEGAYILELRQQEGP